MTAVYTLNNLLRKLGPSTDTLNNKKMHHLINNTISTTTEEGEDEENEQHVPFAHFETCCVVADNDRKCLKEDEDEEQCFEEIEAEDYNFEDEVETRISTIIEGHPLLKIVLTQEQKLVLKRKLFTVRKEKRATFYYLFIFRENLMIQQDFMIRKVIK